MDYAINHEYYRTQYPECSGLVHWDKDVGGFFGGACMGIQGLQWQPRTLYIDTDLPDWPLTLAHEWGHLLLARIKPQIVQRSLDATTSSLLPHSQALQRDIQKAEVMAWRLAKTYLNPTFWDEAEAVEALSSYWAIFQRKFPSKLKIVPYQRG